MEADRLYQQAKTRLEVAVYWLKENANFKYKGLVLRSAHKI